MLPFDDADIRRVLPLRYFLRGQRYQQEGRVGALQVGAGGCRLTALVEGGDGRPYRVAVQVGAGAGSPARIEGRCDCPIGYNCKHVAATLLEAIERQTRMGATAGPLGGLDAALGGWLERLERSVRDDAAQGGVGEAQECVLYILTSDDDVRHASVTVLTARRLRHGGYGKAAPYSAESVLTGWRPRFLSAADGGILARLALQRRGRLEDDHRHPLDGPEAGELLAKMLATGRCHWRDKDTPPLRAGEPRQATAEWKMDVGGAQHCRLRCSPAASAVLALLPPWYIDEAEGTCGPLDTGLPAVVAAALAEIPPVQPQDVERLQQYLRERLPAVAMPLPRRFQETVTAGIRPVPCLLLGLARVRSLALQGWGWGPASSLEMSLPVARLSFDYEGVRVPFGVEGRRIVTRVDGDRLRRIERNREAEHEAFDHLCRLGLASFKHLRKQYLIPAEHEHDLTILPGEEGEDGHCRFVLHEVPALRDAGWQIDTDPDFPFRTVGEVDAWYAEVDERSGSDWFGLELGVEVEGTRISLLPLLVQLVRDFPLRMAPARLQDLPDEHLLTPRLEDGRVLPLPVGRVRPILLTLVELFGRDEPLAEAGQLRLPALQAARLADLDSALPELRWTGGTRVRELGSRLRDFRSVRAVEPPSGFRAQLRAYQRHGLNWLQFLREYRLGGILADDMGLGKTVQVLAHLLFEKEHGRMDRPSLVVVPTSLMFNWRAEAARFAPQLRVLVSHGAGRRASFERIPEHDLVLTSYALLARDRDALLEHDYHYLVLDEAQAIKNPQARVAQEVQQVRSRHRLCMTGTPMENHLGELWSLMSFLNPGLLGTEREFRRLFRTPIERDADEARRTALARRIAPFLLRRSKEEVVRELPPKSEIVRGVELAGPQRDLYESVRLAMHEKVRREIDSKGLSRSRIVILDALLKLRQICCDPRLLKLAAARTVNRSAKLELLMDLVPEMVEEGRRILLFSQFTSMLGLIEAELVRRRIAYVKLTGQTRDRSAPVGRFQSGEVPLFLISLKAGGTGLNLTAADTVIHYDPWWNPAAETQATDRAHRIGQDKPVFVYKLVTEGTVEEKILALQERKQALAAGVLGEGGDTGAPLTCEDLEALFEPL
jgi:hypothetical protein